MRDLDDNAVADRWASLMHLWLTVRATFRIEILTIVTLK
jgi:hypothetical protein